VEFVIFIVAVAIAGAVGFMIGRRPAGVPRARRLTSADDEHVLDLLRRAHGAVVSVALEEPSEPFVACDVEHGTTGQVERGTALARVALGDERRHRLEDAPVTVAAAYHGVAVALVFSHPISAGAVERAQADAWRLAAGIADRNAVGSPSESGEPDELGRIQLSETLDSVALMLCDAVARRAARPTMLVLRDEFTGALHVVRVSVGGDRRLEGTSALPESAVARAVDADVPVAARSFEELLGHPQTDRRREVAGGIAFPIRDGRRPAGAMLVLGAPERIEPDKREAIEVILAAAAPRVVHLQALESRELRARTDELTGLPNRRGLDHAMSMPGTDRAALLIVDLDHFKRVNDTYGHVAGDAALRHLAVLLRRALRTGDLAARIGGEEFALWLPVADLAVAREVAERVREMVVSTPVRWGGQEIALSCSVGVAAMPESTSAVANLYPAADAALYRAKQRGRNRVETAAGQAELPG
jgi:diguanylate cyclase (GGDEF)-like protein